jgi:4-amino-4-deoxy-L-arabinose transferase-like glycosyltransferase
MRLLRVAREVNRDFAGRRTQLIGFAIIAIILLRGLVAALTPLSYDEAYYWLWSKHLAGGYYDHPPMIAFIIRAGTALFGDTSAGVRFVPWLLSAAASFAVWRTGAILLKSEYAGALSALLFNLMPMIGVEALVATPDSPEIAASAFVLFALAKVGEAGRSAWWLAVGIAAGLALLSKYTAFFLGAGILVWLALVPKERHWFLSFWPYLGGVIALLIFLPVVLWNAQHDWLSFALQFGRVERGGFTLRYLGEFLAAQLGLATPFIAILGGAGIFSILRSRAALRSEPALLAAMITPAAVYFVWHSLHDRVQGNWPSFLYPAFAIAAAAAFTAIADHGGSWLLRLSRRFAIPFAAVVIALIYAQGLWGVIPRLRDPVSRLLAVGMGRVVDDIESLRAHSQAGAIVTTSYALTGWLTFYMPTHPPVIQLNERFRYINEPPPDAKLFAGPLLYVTEARNDQSALLAARFAEVKPLAQIARYRNGATIDEYRIYSVKGAKGEPLAYGK